MDFSVREATLEDYAGLCEVYAEGDSLHWKTVPQVFQDPGHPVRTKDYFSAILADKNQVLLVAEKEGRIIGFNHVVIKHSPDMPVMVHRRYALVVEVGARENFRRSRVCTSLFERAYQWAMDRNVTQFELAVWEFNKGALAFFQKLGFRTMRHGMWKSLQ